MRKINLLLNSVIALLVLIISVLFIPVWLSVLFSIVLASIYRKWYHNAGFFLAVILIFVFVIIPLGVAWLMPYVSYAYPYFGLFLTILDLLTLFVPKMEYVPLVSFTPNGIVLGVSLDIVICLILVSYLVILLVVFLKRVKVSLFILSGAVYYFSCVVVPLGFVDVFLRFAGLNGLYYSVSLVFPQFPIFYHIAFNVLPSLVISLFVLAVFKRLIHF